MDTFTEQKFAVLIEEVDVPLSPGLTNVHEDHSLCSCVVEIKYLKDTVKQLISQVNKQNHAISGIKSGLKNAVLSLSSCYSDDKDDQGAFTNQDADYSIERQITTASELGTNFDDQLPPQLINLSSTQCEQIQDPLQDETTCASISIENCNSAAENYTNGPIITASTSQAVTLENELDDEDDEESICDIDDNEEDDELYAASEIDISSDQDLDNAGCEKETRKTDHPENEMATSSREVFRCTKCPKKVIYKTMRTMRDHMRRYHSTDPHKCHLCDKTYVKKSSLAHHIHSVHKGNRLKCAYCPGSFVQLGKLRVHEKIHLVKDGPPLQCCEFCGMNFRTVKSLLAHLGAMHKDTDQKHYAIGVKTIKNNRIKRKK